MESGSKESEAKAQSKVESNGPTGEASEISSGCSGALYFLSNILTRGKGCYRGLTLRWHQLLGSIVLVGYSRSDLLVASKRIREVTTRGLAHGIRILIANGLEESYVLCLNPT